MCGLVVENQALASRGAIEYGLNTHTLSGPLLAKVVKMRKNILDMFLG